MKTLHPYENTKYLHYIAAFVVALFALTFIALRVQHSRQVEATRGTVLVYSPLDSSSSALAERVGQEAGIRSIVSLDPKASIELRRLYSRELVLPALLLPGSHGYAAAQGSKVVEEILAPVLGAPTPALRGSIMALAAAAIWGMGWIWRRKVAYLGIAYPAIGSLALGLAVPACPECQGSVISAWLAWMGMAAFGLALLAFTASHLRARWVHGCLVAIGVLGASAQAGALSFEPKLCGGCLAGTVACAGLYWTAQQALSGTGPAILIGPRWAAVGVLLLSICGAGRYVLFPSAAAKSLKTFQSVIGRNLSDYVQPWQGPSRRELVVVTLAGCEACGSADAALRISGLGYRTVPYETLLDRGPVFRADFSRVAPLFLLCDRTGRILHAEAGWPSSPESQKQMIRRFQISLGGENETH